MGFFAPLSAFFSVPRGIFTRRLAIGLFLAAFLPFLAACVEDRPAPKTATDTPSPALFGEGGLLGALGTQQDSSIGVRSEAHTS